MRIADMYYAVGREGSITVTSDKNIADMLENLKYTILGSGTGWEEWKQVDTALEATRIAQSMRDTHSDGRITVILGHHMFEDKF